MISNHLLPHGMRVWMACASNLPYEISTLLRIGRRNFDRAVQIPLNRKVEAECGLTWDGVGVS